ncbi:MAG: hypothetical protein M3Y64_00010 [Gemmatimonadota bacterium]|nr:hypothetical protein [Gemmatimonadota bacterium]
MSCLSRVGCVTVLVVGGVGAWWLYGGTTPGFVRDIVDTVADRRVVTTPPPVWASAGDAKITQSEALGKLERPIGPAYVTLAPGDVAAFLADALRKILPGSAGAAEVAIVDDQLHLRAGVLLRELGHGVLADLLSAVLRDHRNDEKNATSVGAKDTGQRDTIELAGTLELIRPGLGQFRVREIRVQNVGVPPRLIPSLLAAMRKRDAVSDSVASDAVPVTLPAAIADVRISHGKITLYKAAPLK